VLFCYLRLDEIVLGENVRVARIAMGMEMGQSLERFVCTIMIREPSARC
jgi:hypothetical protein